MACKREHEKFDLVMKEEDEFEKDEPENPKFLKKRLKHARKVFSKEVSKESEKE